MTFTPIGVVFFARHGKCFQFRVKRGYISKLRVTSGNIIQRIPFGHAFYAFESLLFYIHCNKNNNVIVIPLVMETCQNDPLGGRYFFWPILKFKLIGLCNGHRIFYDAHLLLILYFFKFLHLLRVWVPLGSKIF